MSVTGRAPADRHMVLPGALAIAALARLVDGVRALVARRLAPARRRRHARDGCESACARPD